MRDYLTFQLYGPFASWGDIAVGEVRRSANQPSKSALIGFLGAALGIKRDQEIEQRQLATFYEFSIKLISSGSLLCDYHTVQTVKGLKKRNYHSRREALITDQKEIKTIVSNREYRCDALAIIAVCAKKMANYSLSTIQSALLNPKYHLFLGRKSCPLALPVRPILCQALGAKAALDQYPFAEHLKFLHSWFKFNIENQSGYYWEENVDDLKPEYTVTRHDQPVSRDRWQFTTRSEHYQKISTEG